MVVQTVRRFCEVTGTNDFLLQKLNCCIHIVYNLWIGLLHSDDKIFQKEASIIFVTFILYYRASSLRTVVS
jgi:hypothetical protein